MRRLLDVVEGAVNIGGSVRLLDPRHARPARTGGSGRRSRLSRTAGRSARTAGESKGAEAVEYRTWRYCDEAGDKKPPLQWLFQTVVSPE